MLIHFSGKAIALRLANDGYNICVNDVEANKAGVDDVSQLSALPHETT